MVDLTERVKRERNMNQPPEITPSQCDWLLAQLKAGRKLTALDCLREFGIFRAAARVENLRQLGHQIITERQRVEKANGKAVKVGVYHLAGGEAA